MDRNKIISALKRCTPNGCAEAITITQLQSFFGSSYKTASRRVAGLEQIDGVYYLISDVADKLLERAAEAAARPETRGRKAGQWQERI